MPPLVELEREADAIAAVVARHGGALRAGADRSPFRIGDVTFRLFRADRNTVYRVSGGFEWFLKLPRAGDPRPIAHERMGARVLADVFRACPEYSGSRVARTGMDPAYTLAQAVPGGPLNRALIRESWIPGGAAVGRLERAFGTLGRLLATLHARGKAPAGAPHATKQPFEALASAVRGADSADALSAAIARWHARPQPRGGDAGFVHGHMRLDNVMVDGTRIGFIDLEHSGIGDVCHDLSRPVSQLLLVGTAIAFPRGRALRYLRALLDGYAGIQSFRPSVLDDYVIARVARYYLQSRKDGLLPGRIGGLPVVSSRLRRLTAALLEGGLAAAVPTRPAAGVKR